MPTGDFVCSFCGSFNCNGYCQDRHYQSKFYYYPQIIPIPQPYFVNTKESWQCFGCKRFYAPHINYCNCQHIDNNWTSNKIPETFDNT